MVSSALRIRSISSASPTSSVTLLIRLEQVIAGADLTPAGVIAVLVTAVTAWVTDWMALPMETWAVTLDTVVFGLAALQFVDGRANSNRH